MEEEEGREKSCGADKSETIRAQDAPLSKPLKTIVRFVQVPFTFTGKKENQNAREFPPLGVGFPGRVKLAGKVPLGGRPSNLVIQYAIGVCR
jgi:hypothetical protein